MRGENRGRGISIRNRAFSGLLMALSVALAAVLWILATSPETSSQDREGPSEFKGPALKVFFIDVGQGDGMLVQTPGGKNILIDTGPDERAVPGFLRGRGVKNIEVLVTTHPHSDHIGGAVAVLQSWPVKRIYDSGKPHASPIYERYLERVKQLVKDGQTVFRRARGGDRIEVEPGLAMEVVHPSEPLPDDPNNASVVLRLTYGRVSFLLTGDIGREAEGDILKRKFGVRADILKVGHHGSRTSTSAGFLERVGPKVAVIQSGRGNDYGHPHRETLQRLERQGARIYRNDRDGTILVATDGDKYAVTRMGR